MPNRASFTIMSHCISNTLDRITTPFNACSLETHLLLHQDEEKNHLVVGCYQLNETDADSEGENKKATRCGELRLYTVHNNQEKLRFGEPQYVVDMESGVLDGKWKLCNRERSIFASACASGRIHLHSLQYEAESCRLDHVTSSDIEEENNALCLALAWNEHANDSNAHSIVSSYSDGTIALHDVSFSTNETGMCQIKKWEAHSMFGCPSEVWTCSFLRGDENVVMSGADDVSMIRIQ